MARITFQKRQKEMKRQEKQRMKAEKRAQRKIAKNTEPEAGVEISAPDIYEPEDSAVERWTESEGQRDGTPKVSS